MGTAFYMIMAGLTAISYFILITRTTQKKTITESRVKAWLIQSAIVGLFWMIAIPIFLLIYLIMRVRRAGDGQEGFDDSVDPPS